jgi:hypothetical protein
MLIATHVTHTWALTPAEGALVGLAWVPGGFFKLFPLLDAYRTPCYGGQKEVFHPWHHPGVTSGFPPSAGAQTAPLVYWGPLSSLAGFKLPSTLGPKSIKINKHSFTPTLTV